MRISSSSTSARQFHHRRPLLGRRRYHRQPPNPYQIPPRKPLIRLDLRQRHRFRQPLPRAQIHHHQFLILLFRIRISPLHHARRPHHLFLIPRVIDNTLSPGSIARRFFSATGLFTPSHVAFFSRTRSSNE